MKRILFLTLILAVMAFTAYVTLEPTIAAAADDTIAVSLTVTSQISINDWSTITLSPAMDMTQQNSLGTSTIIVKTNDATGYTLTLLESALNGLTANAGADYFTDMATSVPAVYSEQAASVMKWGFSVFSTTTTDVPDRWDSGATPTSCGNTATADAFTSGANLKWAGFHTAATSTAISTAETSSSGATIALCIVAEYGDSIYAPDGTYTATLTATATTN